MKMTSPSFKYWCLFSFFPLGSERAASFQHRHSPPSFPCCCSCQKRPSTSILHLTAGTSKPNERPTLFITTTDITTNKNTTTTNNSNNNNISSISDKNTAGSKFGQQSYWDTVYQHESEFSWYAGWDDLEPFLGELLMDTYQKLKLKQGSSILIPGVGNDYRILVDMYQSGFQQLTAFDYAPEGIERCREMLNKERIPHHHYELNKNKNRNRNNGNHHRSNDNENGRKEDGGIQLFVGDARNLTNVSDHSFDVVFEKGTLDAIVQSGGEGGSSCTKEDSSQKVLGLRHMEQAVEEFARILKPGGGLLISLSAICTDRLESNLILANSQHWELVRDGSWYMTDDGYSSNNFDGTLLVWKKLC